MKPATIYLSRVFVFLMLGPGHYRTLRRLGWHWSWAAADSWREYVTRTPFRWNPWRQP